jgi:hypothetical protein
VTTTQLAVLAIQVSDAFLGRDEQTGRPTVVHPAMDVVLDLLRRSLGPARD